MVARRGSVSRAGTAPARSSRGPRSARVDPPVLPGAEVAEPLSGALVGWPVIEPLALNHHCLVLGDGQRTPAIEQRLQAERLHHLLRARLHHAGEELGARSAAV